MKVKNKTIVVTGGGSGIGRELVLQLLQKEARVAAADVNEAALQKTWELAGDNAYLLSTHPLDITDKENVEIFPDAVIATHGQIDGLINNAGIIQPFIDVKDLNYDQIRQVMDVNFYGTVYMIKAFLPHLIERPEAHIANVSSMGGFIPFPGQTIYSAAKGAVKMLTEGLYGELMDTRVGVTIVHPGAVNTNIMENSGVKMRVSEELAGKQKTLAADKAAAIIIDAIERNKYRVLVGSDARFLDLFYRFSPRWAVRTIVKKMSAMKQK